jgi:uncharacterized protein YecT (DUF1311 family)
LAEVAAQWADRFVTINRRHHPKTPMKFITATIASLPLLLTTLPGQSAPINPCAAPTTTIDLNTCAQKNFEKKDKELNIAYQALMKSLTPSKPIGMINYPEVRRQLTNAQQDWIRFRDNDCDAKYRLRQDGTIRTIVYLSCKTEHTELRTKQLRNWAGTL